MWFVSEKRLSYLLNKKLFRGYCTKPPRAPRVRFAPSPTGQLHLGGLRTALFNYLFAKSRGGTFILRIEDTDRARQAAGALAALERDLAWAGLRCDEGPAPGGPCAPYVQSERLPLYQEHAARLVDAGAAYRCFCSARRLAALRRDAERSARPPRYDNRCRALAPDQLRDCMRAGRPYCIRFKLAAAPECAQWVDLVFGRAAHDPTAEGDPVLLKSDGWPTYHLASVVDDRAMAVTHVLRGLEWQISTPKHLLLYKAFGWEPPRFGHLPLIVNADGTKLSKRQRGATVADYRDAGVLPLALLNFLTRAGGGFPHAAGAPLAPRSLEELAREFRLELVSTHPTRLDEQLLAECGRLELRRQVSDPGACDALVARLGELVRAAHGAHGAHVQVDVSRERLRRVLRWGARRVSRLNQLLEPELAFLWAPPPPPPPPPHPAAPAPRAAELAAATAARLAELHDSQWEPGRLRSELDALCSAHDARFSRLARAVRGALAGAGAGAGARGPPVAEMLALLGKAAALPRLHSYAAAADHTSDTIVTNR